MFAAGTSFWIRGEDPPHLWIILSDPQIDDQRVLYVNFTSYDANARPADPRNDKACLIRPGEHPFVTHPTCVYYYGGQLASLSHLEWRAAQGDIRLDVPVSPELLQRIRKCAGDSLHMEADAYDVLVNQGLV